MNNNLPRKALLTLCQTSFGLWGNHIWSAKQWKLETVQYNLALAITGSIQEISKVKL